MKIARATTTDIPELCDLLALLFTQEAEFTPDISAQARGLSAIINDPGTGVVLVGRQGEAAVGMVTLLFTVSTALGERVALLEDMVVREHVRGEGVGSRLLMQAIEVARNEGCKRVTLLTDGDNLAAQKFYRKHGFALSGMVPMRLALPRGEMAGGE